MFLSSIFLSSFFFTSPLSDSLSRSLPSSHSLSLLSSHSIFSTLSLPPIHPHYLSCTLPISHTHYFCFPHNLSVFFTFCLFLTFASATFSFILNSSVSPTFCLSYFTFLTLFLPIPHSLNISLTLLKTVKRQTPIFYLSLSTYSTSSFQTLHL